MTDASASARATLEAAHPGLIELSHRIYENPELGYEEQLAAAWLADALETAGFEVQRGYGAMPTAFVAVAGSGPLHIVICAEYDALPAVGHACGHNIICTAGLGAGVALAPLADELGLKVTVLGTPAEEGGGGKIGFIKGGFFDDVHAAMMVHPFPHDELEQQLIAVQQLQISYTGRAAHAAGFPYLGIGYVTKGGDAANVIPEHTSADYMVRADTATRLDELRGLVRRCFEAGALATGATLEIEEDVGYTDVRHDRELVAIYGKHAEALGRTFEGVNGPVSTDMGNVSYEVPSIHPAIGIESNGAVNHQKAFADACATPSADQAIFDGALCMALTCIDIARDDAMRARLLAK